MWVLGGVLAASLVLGWAIRLPEIGTGEDEAVYLLLSESVGDGHYRDLGIPGTPPHAKYPPGTAAWIFLVRTTMGENLDAVRMGNLPGPQRRRLLHQHRHRRQRQPGVRTDLGRVPLEGERP
jgi:hypothetical protein